MTTKIVNQEETIYLIKPDRYFKLNVSSGPSLHILPHLGRIYTGAVWESLGFNPYSAKIRYPDTEEEGFKFGSFQIDQHWYSFTPMIDLPQDILKLHEFKSERISLKEWTSAIKQKKRHVNRPYDVYVLRTKAIPYDEISNLTEYDRMFSEGRLAMDRHEYPSAVEFFESANNLNPGDVRCLELILEARAKACDLGVISQGLSYYVNDMDSAIHCGKAENWLRLTMDVGKDYQITLDVALSIISGIDALIAGRTDRAKRIYSGGKKSWYKYKHDEFVKRLGTLRGFLSKQLIEANRGRAEEVSMLLLRISEAHPAKEKKIHELRELLGPGF